MRYVIYLSRSLRYTEKDDIVRKLLQQNRYFDCEFRMISDLNPASSSDSEEVISASAWKHIENADAILLLAGVYPLYKQWIDSEIKLAKKRKKLHRPKLIFIEVFDSIYTSVEEVAAADSIVKMNAESIICAIKSPCSQ